MSGPKVIRIVTREEVLAICNGHLARLSAAIERWEKIGSRNGTISTEDIAAVGERADRLRALIERDEFLELQKRVPEEIAWIESDVERRLELARQRKIDERIKAGRRRVLARDLLAAHVVTTTDASLRGELERVAAALDLPEAEAEAILSRALRTMVGNGDKSKAVSSELTALAQRLAEGTQHQALDQWLADRDIEEPGTDEVALALEGALADLEVLGAAAAADALRGRAEAIGQEAATQQRRMRADSLLLDISRAARRRRDWLEQARVLEGAIAEAREIAANGSAPLVAEASLLLLNEEANPHELAQCADRLRQVTDELRRNLAAEARRSALLSALAIAGYEAREGLGTASPSDGRLVLRRAANPDAGVEVAIAASGERVQMRPVRFATGGSAADSSRDRDIETAWCGDFDQMREVLKNLHADLSIERALPIVAAPLLLIPATSPVSDRRSVPIVPLRLPPKKI